MQGIETGMRAVVVSCAIAVAALSVVAWLQGGRLHPLTGIVWPLVTILWMYEAKKASERHG